MDSDVQLLVGDSSEASFFTSGSAEQSPSGTKLRFKSPVERRTYYATTSNEIKEGLETVLNLISTNLSLYETIPPAVPKKKKHGHGHSRKSSAKKEGAETLTEEPLAVIKLPNVKKVKEIYKEIIKKKYSRAQEHALLLLSSMTNARLKFAKEAKDLVWNALLTKGRIMTGFRNIVEISNYPEYAVPRGYFGVVTKMAEMRRLEELANIIEADVFSTMDENEHELDENEEEEESNMYDDYDDHDNFTGNEEIILEKDFPSIASHLRISEDDDEEKTVAVQRCNLGIEMHLTQLIAGASKGASDGVDPITILEHNQWFYDAMKAENNKKIQFPTSKYKYDQLQVTCIHSVAYQYRMLMHEIVRLKTFFNNKFNELRTQKLSCIKKIKARNNRLRQIIKYLGLSFSVTIEDLSLNPLEKPLETFTVKKKEIPTMYLSPREKERQDRQRQLDEKWRERRRTGFRARALRAMMDGRLVTRREHLLRLEIPKPAFMNKKDELEFTLEEFLEAREYWELYEELEKARASFRLELAAEFRSLITQNRADRDAFDTSVATFFDFKLEVETNLSIHVAIAANMRIFLARRSYYDRVMVLSDKRLGIIIDEMKQSQAEVVNTKRQLKEYGARLRQIVHAKRTLENSFRDALQSAAGGYWEFLKQEYKSQPKIPIKKTMRTADFYWMMMKAVKHFDDLETFLDMYDYSTLARVVANALSDLNDESQKPEELSSVLWDRFLSMRSHQLLIDYEKEAIMFDEQSHKKELTDSIKRAAKVTKRMKKILKKEARYLSVKRYMMSNTPIALVLPCIFVEFPGEIPATPQNTCFVLRNKAVNAVKRIRRLKKDVEGAIEKTNIDQAFVRKIAWDIRWTLLNANHYKAEAHSIERVRVKRNILQHLDRYGNLNNYKSMQLDQVARTSQFEHLRHKRAMKERERMKKKITQQKMAKEERTLELKADILRLNRRIHNLCRKVIPFMAKMEKRMDKKRYRLFFWDKFREANDDVKYNVNELKFLEEEMVKWYKRTYPVLEDASTSHQKISPRRLPVLCSRKREI